MGSRRRVIWILGAAGVAAAMTSAGMSTIKAADASKNQAYVKEALQEKYSEEFEVGGYTVGDLYGTYFTVEAYAEEMPEIPFDVRVYFEDMRMIDNYVSRRITASLADRAEELLGETDHLCYVYAEPLFDITTETDPNVTIEEFYNKGYKMIFDLYIYYSAGDGVTDDLYAGIERIAEALPDLNGTVEVLLVDDEKIPEIADYIESHTGIDSIFGDKLADAPSALVSVEGGVLTTSRSDFELDLAF